jgi:hypothetical protein
MLFGLLVVLITFSLGGAAQAEKAAPAATRATLTVMDMRPLAISGRGFRSGERVVVSTGTARKSVTASASGRFVVRFASLRCAGTTIVAVGSKGSRARTNPPKILCVEP